MSKYPKWKVNIAAQSFFTVEIEAESQQEAVTKAIREVQDNPEYHATGNATIVSGVFINDREARDYHLFVPERLPCESQNNLPN